MTTPSIDGSRHSLPSKQIFAWSSFISFSNFINFYVSFYFFNKLNKKVEKEKSSFFSESSTSTIATNIFLLLDLVQVIGAKLKCVSICNSSSSFSKSTFQNTHTKHEHCPSFSALHSFTHSQHFFTSLQRTHPMTKRGGNELPLNKHCFKPSSRAPFLTI